MYREMNKVLKIKSGILIFLTVLVLFSCKKKSADYVPTVTVNYLLYTSDPAFAQVNIVGGHTYIANIGVCGIVVYCTSTNPSTFMAYDRCCTYNVANRNVISVDANGVTATDAVCGSKFLLTDGSVNHGPASNILKIYQTSFDGTALHIFN
jgi:hypothetical protein